MPLSKTKTEMKTLLLEQRQGAMHITLNRPALKNAMSVLMIDELHQALAATQSDQTLRLIVLRGAGGNFCAGGDVKDMAAAVGHFNQGESDPIAQISAKFGHLCDEFLKSPLPVVCIVEGMVMGGGFGLACAADVVIASRDVIFALPETSLGLIPAQIMPFLLDRIGYSQTKRLAVTGGRVLAEEALAIGLVHEVADDVDAAITKITNRILACAPNATAFTKKLAQDIHHGTIENAISEAAKLFSAAATSPEGTEGTSAFLAKRLPDWTKEV